MLYEALFVPEGQPKFQKSILDEPEINKYIREWSRRGGDIAIVAIGENDLIGVV